MVVTVPSLEVKHRLKVTSLPIICLSLAYVSWS
jgi:hypothetical protein